MDLVRLAVKSCSPHRRPSRRARARRKRKRSRRGDGLHHVFFSDVRLGFIDDLRPDLGLIRPPVTSAARVK
jgi:hypothetical protein